MYLRNATHDYLTMRRSFYFLHQFLSLVIAYFASEQTLPHYHITTCSWYKLNLCQWLVRLSKKSLVLACLSLDNDILIIFQSHRVSTSLDKFSFNELQSWHLWFFLGSEEIFVWFAARYLMLSQLGWITYLGMKEK